MRSYVSHPRVVADTPKAASTTWLGNTNPPVGGRHNPRANRPSIRSNRTLHAVPAGLRTGNFGRTFVGIANAAIQPRTSFENVTLAKGLLRTRASSSVAGKNHYLRLNWDRGQKFLAYAPRRSLPPDDKCPCSTHVDHVKMGQPFDEFNRPEHILAAYVRAAQ